VVLDISIIRYPLVDEDAEEDQVAKPPYMKFKLDLTWPDCNVKTEVIKSELLDSGKRVREPLEIETVGDFAGHVNYMSKFRPIFRPVKMWAHQQKMKDPQYGIVFKLVKVEVEPNKNSNNVYQNYLQGDIFVDDDEDEAEAPTVFSGVEKVAEEVVETKKTSKKVVKEDSDSSDDSYESDDSDDSDSEEPVQKVAPKKKGGKKATK
jgi:hypothetical protein